jgi:hypothetical protein
MPQGVVTARAAGNASVRSDTRLPAAARRNAASPAPPVPEPLTTAQQRSSRYAYAGPAFRHGQKIASDRHVIERTGTTTSSSREQTPRSGIPNPEADGPARPAGDMVNRTISWQIGTDATRNLDNDLVHARTTAGERAFPLSSQGTGPQPVYGGTPGLVRPYGARGIGLVGPAPRVVSLPGGPGAPGVLLTPGAPGDGPQRVSGGAPHGLHSITTPATKQTLGRYRSVRQQTPGRMTRPANSKIAGQSMSQLMTPLARTRASRAATGAGRQPGVQGRFVPRAKANKAKKR